MSFKMLLLQYSLATFLLPTSPLDAQKVSTFVFHGLMSAFNSFILNRRESSSAIFCQVALQN
jgi:hypothetical protein